MAFRGFGVVPNGSEPPDTRRLTRREQGRDWVCSPGNRGFWLRGGALTVSPGTAGLAPSPWSTREMPRTYRYPLLVPPRRTWLGKVWNVRDDVYETTRFRARPDENRPMKARISRDGVRSAVLPRSRARDAGDNSGCPSTDRRGCPHPETAMEMAWRSVASGSLKHGASRSPRRRRQPLPVSALRVRL